MKYTNLSQQQKNWIAEIQRSFSHSYQGENLVECDPETGRITERDSDGQIKGIGFLPLKAIPYRGRMLEELEQIRSLPQRAYYKKESPTLLRAEGEHHVHMYLAQKRREN